jgi:hypothetical protein
LVSRRISQKCTILWWLSAGLFHGHRRLSFNILH